MISFRNFLCKKAELQLNHFIVLCHEANCKRLEAKCSRKYYITRNLSTYRDYCKRNQGCLYKLDAETL
jgi:hypothetical protein